MIRLMHINKMPMIGIFDSGVGGLTVAREIKKILPGKSIIYFGDTARVPWGNKSPEVIQAYAQEICDFLISKGATKIVIACNTASAFAGDYLTQKYPKIKIYNVIDPVVERVVSENGNDARVGVIGTRGTIASGAYERKITEKDTKIKVYSVACPLFVPLAEEGWGNSDIAATIAEKYLSELKKIGINKLVLGCTHYPLLKEVICNYFDNNIECISSDQEVAEFLSKENILQEDDGEDKFYFSDLSESYLELATNIYGTGIRAEKISL